MADEGEGGRRAPGALRGVLAERAARDHAKEAADQLALYGAEAPMEQAQRMTEVLVDTADLVADSLHGLRGGRDVRSQGITLKRAANGRH